MKKMFTMFLFVLAVISMMGFNGASVYAQATINGATTVCAGDVDVTYKTEPEMMDYIWTVSPGGIITTPGITRETITVTWISPGNQTVEVRYKDPDLGGIVVHLPPLQVSVNTVPFPGGYMNGDIRVCQGDKEVEYFVQPILNATDYVWLIPDGSAIISGAHTNSIKLNYSLSATSGNVAVYGVNDCGEGSVSEFFPIMVNEKPPTPSISLLGDLLISSAPDGNQWYNDGGLIKGANRQEYEVTEEGRYWCVVSLGGCTSAMSNKIDITDLITGVNVLETSTFQIYPVPNNGQFTIRMTDKNATGLHIKIYNNLGMMVYERNNINLDENSAFNVDMQPVTSGSYAIVIENDQIHQMKKILIKK